MAAGNTMRLFSLVLLAVLPAGSFAAARNSIGIDIGLPSKPRRSLLDDAACNFSQYTPHPQGATSRYAVARVPLADALKCYHSILVTRSHATAQITGLKSFFKEYYAYTAIAKDPHAVPGASNISFGLPVYAEKVDLLGGLDAIMDSWEDGDVPLDQVLFPTTHLFNSLHDGHVSYDQGRAFGNVLSSHYLVLWDHKKNATVSLKLKKLKERSTMLAGFRDPSSCLDYTCVLANDSALTQVEKINGQSPLTWITGLVRDAVFDLYLKGVGNRVNHFLNRGYTTTQKVSSLGLFSRLGAANISVQYQNGEQSTWAWYVDIPNSFSSNLTKLGAQASSVGTPYKIQQGLTNVFNENVTTTTTKSQARRHMATGAAPDVKLPKHWMEPGALVGSALSAARALGTFGIKGEAGSPEYSAIFKLTSVGLSSDELLDAWVRFVNLTNQEDVPPTNLIIDVSTNGGGDPQVASLLAALLYPEILQPDNDFVFYTSDPRTVGPFASYLLSQGLFWSAIEASHAIPPPPDAAQARAAKINAKPEILAELSALTSEWMAGVKILKSSDSVGSASVGDLPSFLSSDLYDSAWSTLRTIQKSSSVDAKTFSRMVETLFGIAKLAQPFSETAAPSFFDASTAPLYAADTLQHYLINKQQVTTTAWNYDITKQDYADLIDDFTAGLADDGQQFPEHPFKSVLAVTNGYCGSSCDLLVRVPWTYSRVNASAMPFKTVTFGGTGHEKDITATVFPGGNVEANSDYAQQFTGQSTAWLYYSTLYTLSQWLGDAQLAAKLAGAKALIPAIPEALAYMPRFAYTNSHLPALNSGDVPNEYIMLPPDHYLRQWYYLDWDSTLGRPLYSSADQMALYDAVAKRF